MIQEEVFKILTVLSEAYPGRFNFGEGNKSSDKFKLNLWYKFFKDKPYQTVEAAVEKTIIESPYPPTIHDVMKRIAEVENPNELTEGEAFEKVLKAVSSYGHRREKEAMENLPELAARAAQAIGFKEICMSTNIDVTRGQYHKVYNQLKNKKDQEVLMPEQLKQKIDQIGEGLPEVKGLDLPEVSKIKGGE